MSPTSMYRAVMGESFDRLSGPLRQFHSFSGRHEFHGEVQVGAPLTWLAKILALLLGAPLRASRGPIRFELQAEPTTETWIRHFPSKTMSSTLRESGNRITERLGAAQLTFELLEVDGALEMRLERLYFLGIPCPQWLMPKVIARETGEGQRLHFQIEASVVFIGVVANYTGYLNMPNEVVQ